MILSSSDYIPVTVQFIKNGSQGKHHYVREVVKGKQVAVGRASEGRIQFRPMVKPHKPNIFRRMLG